MNHDQVFLQHILQEIDFLLNETQAIDYDAFKDNEVLTRACTRSLEIIGEASKNLSDELRARYGNIEWKKISGLRDKMAHHYFGIDWNIVWDTIKNRLPMLKDQVEAILKDIQEF